MDKKYIESNHSNKKPKGKDKGIHALYRISKGLSKANAERMAKFSK